MAKKNKNQKQRRLEDKVQSSCSVIAAQSYVEGRIKTQDDLLVSGRFNGDIECSGLVRLGQGGKLQGDIHSRYIIIEGQLTGDIKEAEQVEIRQNGKMNGNITTHSLAMAEGSVFQGNIRMSQKGGKPTHFVERRQKESSE